MARPGRAAILLSLVVALAACGSFRDSRLNPFNWFQPSQPYMTTLEPEGGFDSDRRPLVDQVTELAVEPLPGGAIVRAVGLPPTQGYWDAALVAENFGEPVDGVMTYRFVAWQPPVPSRVSTVQSRELTAGAYLADAKLAQITEIVVLGERQSRSTRR